MIIFDFIRFIREKRTVTRFCKKVIKMSYKCKENYTLKKGNEDIDEIKYSEDIPIEKFEFISNEATPFWRIKMDRVNNKGSFLMDIPFGDITSFTNSTRGSFGLLYPQDGKITYIRFKSNLLKKHK